MQYWHIIYIYLYILMHILCVYFTVFFTICEKKIYMIDLVAETGVLSNRNEIPMNL